MIAPRGISGRSRELKNKMKDPTALPMWRVLCDTGFRPSYQGTKASARLVAGLNGGGFIWHIKYPWWVTRVDCSCKTCIAYHISDCRKNLGCTSCNPPKPPTPPASKIPEIKPMVIPLHTLEALLSEQDVFHFIPNSKLPPHASAPAKKELNKSSCRLQRVFSRGQLLILWE